MHGNPNIKNENIFANIFERIACYFNAFSNTSGKNVITLMAIKETRKLKKKIWPETRNWNLLRMGEYTEEDVLFVWKESVSNICFQKMFLREGADKNFHVANGAEWTKM